MTPQKILITCGLPYANGNAHLGHLVEYLLGDIYSRALKLMGEDAIFLCASDTHGAPIEVKAREANMDPAAFVEKNSLAQQADFKAFGIEFDYFYTTHSPENEKHANLIFQKLKERGHITTRDVEQYYCENDKRFLPDRFIKGVCPFCNSADQFGDVCEICGKTYNPTDLKGPFCVLCRAAPVRRSSNHYFFTLSAYTEFLQEWLSTPGRVPEETKNFVQGWIDQGLRDWDISRDGPYFGFKIPGEQDKYFYVWLDAPVGYISTTEKYCQVNGKDFNSYWHSDAKIEHIIGKDIVYFHALFWPAMLHGSGYTLPSHVHVHGMLTVNGEKMGKARGNFINARTYLEHLDPQYLRYFFARHMVPSVVDLDLDLGRFDEKTKQFDGGQFTKKVNGELVNNIVNLASRSIQLVQNVLQGRLGKIAQSAKPKLKEFEQQANQMIALYRQRNFAEILSHLIDWANWANTYQQEQEPWKVAKTDPEKAREALTAIVNVVKLLAVWIKPVLPVFAKNIEDILLIKTPLLFKDAICDLEERELGPFVRLLDRVDPKQCQKVLDDSKPKDTTVEDKKPEKNKKPEKKVAIHVEPPSEISFEDFAKVSLRVGHILAAELVPKAEKLLKLSVDLGEGAPRTIVSGIAKAYTPEEMVNRKVAIVANLGKKALLGIESHGMILAAGEPPVVVFMDDSLAPGSSIR
jgi:methionyl-tRNA synthetase